MLTSVQRFRLIVLSSCRQAIVISLIEWLSTLTVRNGCAYSLSSLFKASRASSPQETSLYVPASAASAVSRHTSQSINSAPQKAALKS